MVVVVVVDVVVGAVVSAGTVDVLDVVGDVVLVVVVVVVVVSGGGAGAEPSSARRQATIGMSRATAPTAVNRLITGHLPEGRRTRRSRPARTCRRR